MRARTWLAAVSTCWLAISIIAGCSQNSAPPMAPVAGTVKIDSKPLAEGFIYFKTIETGALERFDIKDGEFTGNAQVGLRRVEIIANQSIKVEIDGRIVEVPKNIIDSSCNIASTLTADVSSSGPNRFHFDAKLKK